MTTTDRLELQRLLLFTDIRHDRPWAALDVITRLLADETDAVWRDWLMEMWFTTFLGEKGRRA